MAGGSDDFGGCLVGLFAVAAIGIAIYVLVVFILPVLVGIAALLGSGVALYNYGNSFVDNVRPEWDHDGMVAKIILGVLGIAVIATLMVVVILKQ